MPTGRDEVRRRLRRLTVLGVGAVLALGTAACGDDGSGDSAGTGGSTPTKKPAISKEGIV
jgi:hypothetical protein